MERSLSNDDLQLLPDVSAGMSPLEIDFPAVHIGVAQYTEGPTGCTVFHFPQRATFAADVRGGSPGAVLLGQWESGETPLDALCFSGGSVYGLEAISGVYAELFAARNYSTVWYDLACAAGAIIYDYRPRANAIYPDKRLGQAAFQSAKSGLVPMGAVGAGCSATVGKGGGDLEWESAGQGAAFRQIGATRILVCTVVNSIGVIVDRSGNVVRGNRNRSTGERQHFAQNISLNTERSFSESCGNTTLTTLITNQRLDPFALRQLAKQVHASMARAIQPFHTQNDGDVFFAVSTAEVTPGELDAVDLGVVGSELAWDAVLQSFNSGK